MGYYGRIRLKQWWLISRVAHIFRLATRYHWPAERINEQLAAKVYRSADYTGLPRYAQNWVDGYIDATRDIFFRQNVEWRVCLDGKYIDGDNVPHDRWGDVTPGQFFYIGTDVPYSEQTANSGEV